MKTIQVTTEFRRPARREPPSQFNANREALLTCIDLNHVVLDTLHALMRVMDRLLDRVINFVEDRQTEATLTASGSSLRCPVQTDWRGSEEEYFLLVTSDRG